MSIVCFFKGHNIETNKYIDYLKYIKDRFDFSNTITISHCNKCKKILTNDEIQKLYRKKYDFNSLLPKEKLNTVYVNDFISDKKVT